MPHLQQQKLLTFRIFWKNYSHGPSMDMYAFSKAKMAKLEDFLQTIKRSLELLGSRTS